MLSRTIICLSSVRLFVCSCEGYSVAVRVLISVSDTPPYCALTFPIDCVLFTTAMVMGLLAIGRRGRMGMATNPTRNKQHEH